MFGSSKGARILSQPEAVVQMPGRRYPALAVQGDTLGAWAIRMGWVLSLAKKTSDPELIAHCEDLKKQIDHCVETYNRVCREEGGTGLWDQDTVSRP